MSGGLGIGRVVHFVVREGEHRPADVLRVNGAGNPDLLVKLIDTDSWQGATTADMVLDYSGFLGRVKDAPYDEEMKPGTWHWPERI